MGYGNLNKTTLKRLFRKRASAPQLLDSGRFQNQERACQALKTQFDSLELSLARDSTNPDIGQLRKILKDINLLLQSDSNPLLEDGYKRLLKRLTQIYTRGITRHDNPAFTDTAASYADVIEGISQAYPNYDYSEAVGHLLHYMNRLYQLRERSWLIIFEHLVSMPDSIRVIQLLKNRHLKEIQQWIEEGVHNLFQLRDDQLQMVTEYAAKLLRQEERISAARRRIERHRHAKVVSIFIARDMAELATLFSERERLENELDNKNRLVELLDENIHEFEEKLAATRRAYLIHLV